MERVAREPCSPLTASLSPRPLVLRTQSTVANLREYLRFSAMHLTSNLVFDSTKVN